VKEKTLGNANGFSNGIHADILERVNDKTGSSTVLVIVVLLAAAGTAGMFGWFLPKRRAQQRARNEVLTIGHLATLASAEADYRANDRDGNKVNDFWTGDVAGLAALGLIDPGIAAADARPLLSGPPSPVPFHGHLFAALDADTSVTPPVAYRQDTDGKSGRVHHRFQFGFVAYPAEPGRTGNYIFILNENNTMFRADYRHTPVPRVWPSDTELKSSWSKFD